MTNYQDPSENKYYAHNMFVILFDWHIMILLQPKMWNKTITYSSISQEQVIIGFSIWLKANPLSCIPNIVFII